MLSTLPIPFGSPGRGSASKEVHACIPCRYVTSLMSELRGYEDLVDAVTCV